MVRWRRTQWVFNQKLAASTTASRCRIVKFARQAQVLECSQSFFGCLGPCFMTQAVGPGLHSLSGACCLAQSLSGHYCNLVHIRSKLH